jgi:hypothetical protein
MAEEVLRVKIPAMTTKKGRETMRVIAFKLGQLAKEIEAAAMGISTPISTTEGSQNANV